MFCKLPIFLKHFKSLYFNAKNIFMKYFFNHLTCGLIFLKITFLVLSRIKQLKKVNMGRYKFLPIY